MGSCMDGLNDLVLLALAVRAKSEAMNRGPMPSEFDPTPYCPHCDYGTHHCSGCGAPLTHADCNGSYKGCCDDCQPLMQARP